MDYCVHNLVLSLMEYVRLPLHGEYIQHKYSKDLYVRSFKELIKSSPFKCIA